jgi:hypothetical protein
LEGEKEINSYVCHALKFCEMVQKKLDVSAHRRGLLWVSFLNVTDQIKGNNGFDKERSVFQEKVSFVSFTRRVVFCV